MTNTLKQGWQIFLRARAQREMTKDIFTCTYENFKEQNKVLEPSITIIIIISIITLYN